MHIQVEQVHARAVPICTRDLVLGQLVEATTAVEFGELVDRGRFPEQILGAVYDAPSGPRSKPALAR